MTWGIETLLPVPKKVEVRHKAVNVYDCEFQEARFNTSILGSIEHSD